MVINEAALRDIGWPSAEGRQIKVGSTVYDVIGVVQDYHFLSLASKVAPVLHFFRPPESGVHRVISAKITPGNIQPPLDFIEQKWSTLDPTRPFEFTFVDENIEQLYQNDQRLASVASSFALIAIIIACLGLFALSAIMVTQRTKEIGIRKTLGASIPGIVYLLTKAFTRQVGFAFILAVPVAYFAADAWLSDFAYRTKLSIDVFITAGFVSLLIAFITVSYHSIKAALANPIRALRHE